MGKFGDMLSTEINIGKDQFFQALNENSLELMQTVSKSDLHNHAGRGGNISYIEQWANVKISPPTEPFDSLAEMNQWLQENVKCHCPGNLGYLKRIEAAFAQANKDNIKVLVLSFGVDEIDLFGSMDNFTNIMNDLHRRFAPDTNFYPDLALGYAVDTNYERNRLDEIFAKNWFCGIDICNYSNFYDFYEMQEICKKANNFGMILKAHIGEFGGADDVLRYAEELELNEIQHGIAAADSPQIMRWLAKNGIQLNICPTSNIMLKNAGSYQTHQIRRLFDFGVLVTINSDDLMIFNATVSQEYLNLYNAGLMTANELYSIRQTGLEYKYRKS